MNPRRERQQFLFNWLNVLSIALVVVAVTLFAYADVASHVIDADESRTFTAFAMILAVVAVFIQLSMAQLALPGVSMNRLPPSIVELLQADYEAQSNGTFLVRNTRGFNQALNHYRTTTNCHHGMKWTDGEYVGVDPDPKLYPVLVQFETNPPNITASFTRPS